MGIGGRTECSGTTAKNLGPCVQLGMNFEADDWGKFHFFIFFLVMVIPEKLRQSIYKWQQEDALPPTAGIVKAGMADLLHGSWRRMRVLSDNMRRVKKIKTLSAGELPTSGR
jgi:hypothetical protein